MTQIFIKNMVCNRCITAVRGVLEDEGLDVVKITLGEVEVAGNVSREKMAMLDRKLDDLGFERIDDKKRRVIEKIKNLIIDLVHHAGERPEVNLSGYLSSQLHLEYHYLSALFSEVEATTIEKYFIAQKIEKVKELLVYDELTLSQIADLLHYSSVAHLSSQFKKVTGLTPSHFKKTRSDKRKPLDEV